MTTYEYTISCSVHGPIQQWTIQEPLAEGMKHPEANLTMEWKLLNQHQKGRFRRCHLKFLIRDVTPKNDEPILEGHPTGLGPD